MSTRLRWQAAAALVIGAALVALSACGSDDQDRAIPAGAWPPARPASTDPDATPELHEGMARVTRIAAFDDTVTALTSDPDRRVLFVATRHGTIYRIPIERTDGVAHPGTPTVELDLSAAVSTEDERGLLDLQPVADGRRLAIASTDPEGAVTVRLVRVDGTHLVDDIPDPVLVSVPHPYAGHNGGGLATTEDGDLLLSLGDMASGELATPLAQDASSVLGGVVRIPASHLLDGARPVDVDPSLLIAKGLRNPWRISRDPVTDSLWIGDVGESTWEEIDELASVSTAAGVANFGWPAFEADGAYRDEVTLLGGTAAPPVVAYRHGPQHCAVTVGGVYRGGAIAPLEGALVFGDVCSGEISAVDADRPAAAKPVVIAAIDDDGIVSFDRDADADLYALTSAGAVYRIDPATWDAPDVTATVTADTPTTTTLPASDVECQAAAAIEALSTYVSLDPAQLQQALDTVVAALGAAGGSAPNARRSSYELLTASFERFRTTAAGAGYVATDPAVAAIASDLFEGRGQETGFPDAVSTVMGIATTC